MAEGGQLGTRSVLFTDLVGSTELRVRLGEEGADAVRRVHDGLLGEVVMTHAGTVVKGLGDGIMATFESAADAVAASVAIQQAVHAHRHRTPDQAFEVRVGLSIGDVSAEEGDVFGVPVVEASRLCAAATGGEILAAELVRALARGRGGFVFEPMGDLELKGLPERLSTCRVTWEPLVEPGSGRSPSGVPFPPPLLGSITSYVGRQELRDRLGVEWASVRTGCCRTVLLAGEPGVGKTRTASELARQCFSDGSVVLYGRCDEDLGVPYQPFVEGLEHYVHHAVPPQLGRLPGELARLVPDLVTHVRGLPAPAASDPASEEFRLFEATASWLLEVARADGQGLLLVLDDIHWATKPTLQLMLHVVRAASDAGVALLVLATYRDTDIDRAHPLSALLSDLRRLPGVERIGVENLSKDEVVEMIATAAGHALDADTLSLAGVIHTETEGNPFFIAEVLRHLIESGGVRREGERWVVVNPGHVTVPEGVRDVVGRRLNRLSERANEVLTVGAVVGRDFDIGVLLALVDGTEDATLDALDEAVRARLVEETRFDEYRFAHALVRTTLYEELSATRRRRLHRRVADALEKLRPHDVRALAYHCTEGGPDGGDLSRALRYTLAAAEEALAARAFAEAEVRFHAALELAEDSEQPDGPETIAALCGLGESQRDQGHPTFRLTLLDAANRAIGSGAMALGVRAVLANTRGYVSIISGVDPERVACIEAVLELLDPAPGPDRARVTALLAQEMTFSGDNIRRLELVDQSESMARSLGDPVLLRDVLVMTAFASFSADRWDQWMARQVEATALADASEDRAMQVIIRLFLCGSLLSDGQLAEVARVTEEFLALSARDVAPHVRWTADYHGVRNLLLAGDIARCEARNTEMMERGVAIGQADATQWWAAILMGLSFFRGDAGSLADASAEFADQFPQAKPWRCVQAWLLAEAGRADEARAVVRDYSLEPAVLIREPWVLHPVCQLALALPVLDDAELAAALVEALAPHRKAWMHYYIGVLGPVSWALGLAHSVAGSHDDAVAVLEDALAQVRAEGLPLHAPRLMLDVAWVLRRRNAPGDAMRASALVDEARAEAEAVGATPLVLRIDAMAAAG
jgi:class 3 adenylate cyclase/DNA polymerase III delta prime subunit